MAALFGSEGDEELFIEMVEEREALYNISHSDYSNKIVKSRCWREIEGAIKIPGKMSNAVLCYCCLASC